MNWYDSSLVVFNPLTRRSEDAFDLGPQDLDEGYRGHFGELDSRLLFSDEDPTESVLAGGFWRKLGALWAAASGVTYTWERIPITWDAIRLEIHI
ncbi:hypothetical protein EJB05_53549, partial [Eragrostis curvula]